MNHSSQPDLFLRTPKRIEFWELVFCFLVCVRVFFFHEPPSINHRYFVFRFHKLHWPIVRVVCSLDDAPSNNYSLLFLDVHVLIEWQHDDHLYRSNKTVYAISNKPFNRQHGRRRSPHDIQCHALLDCPPVCENPLVRGHSGHDHV